MEKWDHIRKKVDSQAEEVRKRSGGGELISQRDAALVRESELYAEMDKKRKEEEKKEKLREKIELSENVEEKERSTDSELQEVDSDEFESGNRDFKKKSAGESREESEKKHAHVIQAMGVRSDWVESLSKDGEKRRNTILGRFPIDEIFIKYENGFPTDDFAVKEIDVSDYVDDDRVIVSRSGEDVVMTVDALIELASEKGFVKLSKQEKKKTSGQSQELSEEQKERLRERMAAKRKKKSDDDVESIEAEKNTNTNLEESENLSLQERREDDYENLMGELDPSDQRSIDQAIDGVYEKMKENHFDHALMMGKKGDEGEYNDGAINERQKQNFDVWVIKRASEEYVVRRYLSYSDVLEERFHEADMTEAKLKYAHSLKGIVEDKRFFDVTKRVKDELLSLLNEFGIEPFIYSQSDTWVYWDVAKQKYFFDTEKERDERYYFGDPLEDREIQEQIIDRHFGWEIYGHLESVSNDTNVKRYIKDTFRDHEKIIELLRKAPKENGTLSSLDLMHLGKMLRERV